MQRRPPPPSTPHPRPHTTTHPSLHLSSQMIVKQPYEKRKGPFLINMWEAGCPCKAGLLRRKVCVCPLCPVGLGRKAGPALQAALFCTWDILDGLCSRGSPYCFYRCKETSGKKDGDCMQASLCVHVRAGECVRACARTRAA